MLVDIDALNHLLNLNNCFEKNIQAKKLKVLLDYCQQGYTQGCWCPFCNEHDECVVADFL